MVFKRLFGLRRNTEPRIPHAPYGQRIYAIGDVHGRLDLLDRLLKLIESDDADHASAQTQLIFLGDLVDRGPDSRGVVERVMTLVSDNDNVRCIAGNHEEIISRTWGGDKRSAGLLNKVGGRETLLSYGVPADQYDSAGLSDLIRLTRAHIPREHIAFFKSLDDWIEAGDYLFVHAGVRPGLAIAEQDVSDLRWIRREFTDHQGDFGYCVVHGHTITEGVEERPNRIGIDTAAFATGRLTAIGVEGTDRWFLQT